MKKLRPSTQYKKDLKRIRNNPKKAEALLEVLRLLENELPIPEIYRPHLLTNDYAGCMECHIQGDFLLIWIDRTTNDIDLLRLGSHSELFGKGLKRYPSSILDFSNRIDSANLSSSRPQLADIGKFLYLCNRFQPKILPINSLHYQLGTDCY